jgi:hypothetical protein
VEPAPEPSGYHRAVQIVPRESRVAVVLDDGDESMVPDLWLAPYWQRVPGDYTGDYAKWQELFVHAAPTSLWLRVVAMIEYDGGGTHVLHDEAYRSDDGGRRWSPRQPTPNGVAALPVLAERTTHPTEPPRAQRER